MNATQSATTGSIAGSTPILTLTGVDFYPATVSAPRGLMARQVSAPIGAYARDRATEDVIDLIAAAGPLSASNIAGGLGVSEQEAAARVRALVSRGDLRSDEWGRHRLSGPRANMWL